MISASARRLSVFKAVADHGGFNVAAEKLGIAQPSVGAHIRALERQIGQPLFHRGRGRRSQLTPAGEMLYAYVEEILSQSEAASQALTNLKAPGAPEIAIAAQRAISTYFLPAYLARFAGRHPEVRIVTRTGTTENVLDLVRERAVDLGLFPSLGPVNGVDSVVLSEEPLAFVVAPGHPLAGRRSVTAADLEAHAFVCALRESHHFRMMDQVFRGMGLGRYRVAMELQDFAAVKEMARHGAGIACEMARCLQDDIRAGSLVALDLAEPPPAMQVRCAYRAPMSDNVAELVELLRGSPKNDPSP